MPLRNPFRRAIVGLTLLFTVAVLFPAAAQQKKNIAPPAGATPAGELKGDVAKGREAYSRNCAICHYPASTGKKVGPGLKEIYKRGKFADGKAVNDATMRAWIEEGGQQMPPYKSVMSRQEIADVIAYLRTL